MAMSSSNIHNTAYPASPKNEDTRAIYVGNLPLTISEATLFEIFAILGSIRSIKLIGKSTLNAVNYAFVEYDDPASAETAIETFNGRTIMNSPIKVNWAYTSSTSAAAREETSTHFSIFIGDLATEISDATLRQKFAQYTSLSDARVMWDMKSGRSRGYGFCSFEDRDDAERAILEMTGTFLGSRAIRCNWANLKHSTSPVEAFAVNAHPQSVVDVNQQYSLVLFQTPYSLSTIYLGNLAIDIEVKDLEVLFSGYGGAQDIKLHADRGFAFVKLGSHDSAALAIVQLQGAIVKGRPLKVSCKIVAKMLDLRADHTGQNKSEPQLRARSSSVTNPTSSQDLLSQSPHSSSLVQGYSHESVNHGFSMIPRQIAALQYMTGEQAHDLAQSYSRQRFDTSYAPEVTMQNRSVY